jgi:hypothetical protein
VLLLQYYPPDFDPALLPRGKRGNKDDQMKVRPAASRWYASAIASSWTPARTGRARIGALRANAILAVLEDAGICITPAYVVAVHCMCTSKCWQLTEV